MGWPSVVGLDGVGGRSKREHIYIHVYTQTRTADSFLCTMKTNTTLLSNYTPIRKIKKKRNWEWLLETIQQKNICSFVGDSKRGKVIGAGFYICACSLVCTTNSLLYLSQAFSKNSNKSALLMSSLVKGYVLKEERAGLNLFWIIGLVWKQRLSIEK